MGTSDLDELKRFVYDNPDLERLEALLDEFNPFSAMRWVMQEARHSSFLRWLLDPAETHGMGTYFLRSFLKRLAHSAEVIGPAAPTVIDVDTWELSKCEVSQEWQNVDLFIRNDKERFVVVIENKIGSKEHSQQLQRYRSTVERQFPGHEKLYAYLTIGGDEPSDSSFACINYTEVVDLVETTLERRRDQLSEDVRSFLVHYVQMVRRHIVENSEVQEICQRIYEKHKRALDVLFEHRPDRAMEVATILRRLISSRDDLIEDHCSKSSIRFIAKALDFLPRVGDGWTPTVTSPVRARALV